ncbi:ATP-binding protein [Microbulbifer elongatus]|uniref:ATP-binding protein n=1 Tax=Microbulbifer elongatus TaxID=86173 RepID=A0ABT1NX49_9GAMM|nr:ATP-binding protein [Microbulbifer elongatus]MCQ3828462.1 ATP-binding protein [Microbulbifer elongatus]
MADEYISVDPSPASLVESMRDIGYSMESAVADIVDNSIAAQSDLIQLGYSWNSGAPWFAIADNGCGMSAGELADAMRLGCKNPLTERAEGDLGRFGLGLKTASFSQCRLLTVISRKQNDICALEWDLDLIADNPGGGWRIRQVDLGDPARSKERSLVDQYLSEKQGTIILWRKLDRFDGSEKKLIHLIDTARAHLELTFHRFLAPGPGRRRISMTLNGDELKAFNPFFPDHPATQEGPLQTVRLQNRVIEVTPWVLPHHSKVTAEEYRRYAGDGGYLQNQGFYVYRARRLIIRGTWFRLKKKEELTKLVRVQVDIPNSLDHLWKINVNKSHASPPEVVREQLRTIIDTISDTGKRVYNRRGTKLRELAVPLWSRTAGSGGAILYSINRNHGLIESLNLRLPEIDKKHFSEILNAIESGFPTALFYSDMANRPENVGVPEVAPEHLRAMLELLLEGVSEPVAKYQVLERVRDTEPFASAGAATTALLSEYGFDKG